MGIIKYKTFNIALIRCQKLLLQIKLHIGRNWCSHFIDETKAQRVKQLVHCLAIVRTAGCKSWRFGPRIYVLNCYVTLPANMNTGSMRFYRRCGQVLNFTNKEENAIVVVIVQYLSHVWFCNPKDCSMPGLQVHHCLPDFAQVYIHWIGDIIQPSHPLPPSSPFLLQSFPTSGSFPLSWLFASGGQNIGASASAFWRMLACSQMNLRSLTHF